MKYLSLIIQILVVVALIAVGVLIYSTCAGTAIIQTIDKTMPDASVAPFEVATITKLYKARFAVLNEDKSVTMTNWYEKDGKKWVPREGSITLPPVLRPRISRR